MSDAPSNEALLRSLASERDALRATLAASCDDERSQLWEAGPGGGCSRALDAERERDALRAALDAERERIAQLVDAQAAIYAAKLDATHIDHPRWDEREARRETAEHIAATIRATSPQEPTA